MVNSHRRVALPATGGGQGVARVLVRARRPAFPLRRTLERHFRSVIPQQLLEHIARALTLALHDRV